ncbi:MAG: hypothetical protein IPJ19_19655 [Planctomycetes bacterium]|nr:hypothetical protein [Planctomycetota bacterium]
MLFAISAVVHLLVCTHLAPDWGKYPFALHLGVFAVGLPTVLALVSRYRGGLPAGYFLGRFREQSARMRVCSAAVLGYAMLNFVLCAAGVCGDPKTDLVALRIFSGHWMAIYWSFFWLLRSPI